MAILNSQRPSEINALEADATQLLAEVAAGRRTADASVITDLEQLASAASKLAYGSGHPEWLSMQMGRVIAWCDHLDDETCARRFTAALSVSPLPSPPWHHA